MLTEPQGHRAEREFVPETDVRLTAVLALSGANWLPHWFRPQGSLRPLDVAEHFATVLLRGIEARPDCS